MTDAVADIPRYLTAFAEAGACIVYILLLPRRMRAVPTSLLVAAGCLLLAVVQVWAGTLPLALWIPGMLIAAAAMFGLLLAALRVTATTAGYLTARAFVLAELVASISWQVARFYSPDGATDARIPVFVLVGVPALVLAWIAERRHHRTGTAVRVGAGELVGALAIAAVTFAMSNLSFVSDNTPFSGRLGPELLYIRTLVDLCGFIALYVQHEVREQLNARRDAEAMEQLLRSQHEQYEISRRSIDEVNRKYHDMKHHVDAIRAEVDPAARGRILDALEDSMVTYGAVVRTGNGVLDAVLTAKRMYAEEHGVEVSYVADGQAVDFLEPLDLTSIVGNALDNAVEAALRLDDPADRMVRVALFAQDDFVMLRVENTFDGVIERRDGRMATRKRVDGHGYGLRSIELSVAEYEGTVSVSSDSRWFTLLVLFPRHGASRR